MTHKIDISFSKKSIKKAIKDLQDYAKWLEIVVPEFQRRVAQCGYAVAIRSVGGYDVAFEITNDGNDVLLVGISEREYRSWYNNKYGTVENWDYSPILMAEYGSGSYAEPTQTVDGLKVGYGTFPTNEKPRGTWKYREWYGDDLHTSSGEQPTRPMHKAWVEMQENVVKIAKEVLGGSK